MKKLTLTTIFAISAIVVLAQAPQGISHQAVIRNAANELVSNSPIGIKVSILQSSASGTVVYSEIHNPTSNANGLISFVIGQGSIVSGVLAEIDWSAGPYFIKTEADPAGGSSYTITGTSQVFSVPYALHAGSSADNQWIENGSNIYYNDGHVGIGTENPSSSALFEVESDNKGFLPPRMTTSQMNAITSPAEGLTIYNISMKSLCYYDGTLWVCSSREGTSCGDINYGGKTYSTVIIGTQCWMAQNLNIGIRINGTSNQSIYVGIEKYCYNDLESNCDIYGGLYQWNEMMNYDTLTPGSQGICPTGWHIPTDNEWTVLEDYLGGSSVAGGKMKTTGTSHWSSPNAYATNSSGFSALPGGYRIISGSFLNIGPFGFWWSSAEYSSTYAWYRSMRFDYGHVYRNSYDKTNGFSVRCLRDID